MGKGYSLVEKCTALSFFPLGVSGRVLGFFSNLQTALYTVMSETAPPQQLEQDQFWMWGRLWCPWEGG